MWIVRLALRRPYTTLCMALLMLLVGTFAATSMSTDIFPTTNIPIVSVVWTYNGLPANQMAARIVTIAERSYTTTVSDIEHIESESLDNIAVIRIYIQPTGNIANAIAQITATSQSALRQAPPGTTPPAVIQYSATDVPILEVGISSATASEQVLNNEGNNFARPFLITAQGSSLPPVYGGPPTQVTVALDLNALTAKGLSPIDVSNAINAQNIILPSGTQKMGTKEYQVALNASPGVVTELNDVPIKMVNGQMVFIKDVANVREGAGVQTNIVRINSRRAAYIEVLKSGSASTISVVNRIRKLLPMAQAAIPADIKLDVIQDQSQYVRDAISGVIREGTTAALLTALMILLFLGSWRSTIIVAISIPLSILTSAICLWALGQTINIQTLGGLALAVGILVDDATVEIENVHRNMSLGKDLMQAIIDGASQVAVPAIVASLSICVVFLPIFFLSDASASLFRPLAMAVIFAILASYLLSRTLVPTMVHYMLGSELDMYKGTEDEQLAKRKQGGWIWRVNASVERGLSWVRDRFAGLLGLAIEHKAITLGAGFAFVAGSMFLIPAIGEDFFPTVDAGMFQLHVRAPGGTRLEQMELVCGSVERTIRRVIAPADIQMIRDNIGLAGGGLSLATGDLSVIGPADAALLVTLNAKRSASTAKYQRLVLDSLQREFPSEQFWYQPADIVTEVLNQGLAAPIDVQIAGRQADTAYALARLIASRVRRVPGAGGVRIRQVMDEPEIFFTVDRDRAQTVGLTQQNVAQALLVSLSGSFQSAPNFWLDTTNGVNYSIAVQTPQYKLTTLDQLTQTPVAIPSSAAAAASGTPAPTRTPQLLANLVTMKRRNVPAIVNHYNIQPDVRRVRGARRPRPRRRRERRRSHRESDSAQAAARNDDHRAGTSPKHARVVQGAHRRNFCRAHSGVPHPHGDVPDVPRSVDHHRRAPRRRERRAVGALRHRHHVQRSVAHGNDHVARRRDLEQRAADHLRRRRAARRIQCARRGHHGGRDTVPSRAHDRAGDDHRHDSDGPRAGCRRRRKCAAGARRHRWASRGQRVHAYCRSGAICCDSHGSAACRNRAARGDINRGTVQGAGSATGAGGCACLKTLRNRKKVARRRTLPSHAARS